MRNKKEKNKKRIALTWGYTWWHAFPLLSVYNYLKEKWNYKFVWIWEQWEIEEYLALKNKIDFIDIPAWKIRRYFDFRNFYEPLKNLTWICFWIYYILTNKIDIVFSKWWYVAIPLSIAAFILRKPIYIHESDTVWWIANRIIWKIATKVFYTFPNEKIDWEKYILSWQILNPELIDWINTQNFEQNQKLSITIMWWSQWSTKIFEAMLKLLPDFSDINFKIILWKKNLHFKNDFAKFQNVTIYDFLTQKKIGKLLTTTDIAITRWWATSLMEQNVFWIHSIIVPLSESAWNHQEKNAIYFKEKYWSNIVDENNNFEIELYRTIKSHIWFRKARLNIKWFFEPLKIIESEIE